MWFALYGRPVSNTIYHAVHICSSTKIPDIQKSVALAKSDICIVKRLCGKDFVLVYRMVGYSISPAYTRILAKCRMLTRVQIKHLYPAIAVDNHALSARHGG